MAQRLIYCNANNSNTALTKKIAYLHEPIGTNQLGKVKVNSSVEKLYHSY